MFQSYKVLIPVRKSAIVLLAKYVLSRTVVNRQLLMNFLLQFINNIPLVRKETKLQAVCNNKKVEFREAGYCLTTQWESCQIWAQRMFILFYYVSF